MKIFIATLHKEFLVLLRDRSGLAILFIMPLALVIIMALLQDGPYQSFQKSQFPLILVNNDNDTVGTLIENNLSNVNLYIISKTIDNLKATEEKAKKSVAAGKFKAGIIIPDGISAYLKNKARLIVAATFSNQMINKKKLYADPPDSLKIKVFYDPLTLLSFKNTLKVLIEKSTSKLVSQTIVNEYYRKLEDYYPIKNKINFQDCNIVDIKEIPADINNTQIILNSVQHNVPAWTMFAIFFIFLPLAGSIVKERDDGTFLRLKIMPQAFKTIICGKIVLYTIVGFIQFVLMLMTGLFFLPAIGLPALVIGNNLLSVILIVISASLAATGFGVLIGAFFFTHQQVVTFGSISVIILAALGGIWVPVYIMSKTMMAVSKFSPLEWGLHAFNEIFLHNGTLAMIQNDVIKLLGFSLLCFLISYLYYKYRKIK